MARIMLSAMPFTGHVNPVLALADALVARGHAVRLHTGAAFASAVARSGAEHVPWRIAPNFDENNLEDTFPRLVGRKGLGQLLINVQDVFIKTAPAQVADLQAEWEREPWGDLDGRAVVSVSQGTQNIDPTDLLRPTLEALADEDVLVVATTGVRGRDDLPFPVPANARVAGFIPHAHLLPRVELVVTNGGWGGTLGALARGIPLVVGGGDLDKPEVASRVAWAGAGVNLKTGTPSAGAVRAAVRRVRSEPSFRSAAGRVGEQLTALGGADSAASALEDLLER